MLKKQDTSRETLCETETLCEPHHRYTINQIAERLLN
jgi:hypothetical protein